MVNIKLAVAEDLLAIDHWRLAIGYRGSYIALGGELARIGFNHLIVLIFGGDIVGVLSS